MQPNRSRTTFWPFFLASLSGVALDQVTKWAVFSYLPNYGTIRVTPFFNLTLSRNEGGVFGILQGGNTLFVVLSVLAVVVILWAYIKTKDIELMTAVSMGCILAGVVGNLMDRVYYRYVRDFIDLHVGSRHWPTFNMADVLICLGVGLMTLNILAQGTLRPRSPRD